MEVPRKGILVLLLAAAVGLSGCVASAEEQVANGVALAGKAFEAEPRKTNEASEDTEFYLPGGYTVEEPSDEYNIIITKGSESFVLFVNRNEAGDSTLFYDLQKADPEKKWIVDETFEQNGRFGFVTVRRIAEDRFEVVASAGGAKLTTISEGKKIDRNLGWMMEAVRSIEPNEEEQK